MKRLGLICNSLLATLFLAVEASYSANLRAQDVLNALPPKPAPVPAPARQNEVAIEISREESAEAKEMRKEEADRPMVSGPKGGEKGMEAFRARMLEMFDKNKDGRLDDEERAAAKKYAEENGLGRGPNPGMIGSREEMLKRFDKNGNGKIDEDERVAMQAAMRDRTAKMGGPVEILRTDMRRRFDRNANGKIDDDEMPALEQAMRSRLGSVPILRQRYDKNGDGKIDDEEWTAARPQLQQWLNEPAKN